MPQQSHGRLSFKSRLGHRAILGTILALPAALAAIGGGWIAYQALSVRFDRAETEKLRQVQALVRSTNESLQDEISVIRTQALAIRELQRVDQPDLLPSLFNTILCAAEVQFQGEGSSPAITRLLKRPGWTEGVALDEAYLSKAASSVNWAEFSRMGMAMLRLKQDSSRNAEWLTFLFPLPGNPKGAALALVDPMEAFPVFSRWSQRSEGGALHAYLIGGGGTVLAHSQKGYAGADFSRTELFQTAISALLEGKRESGLGRYLSIDQLPTHVAYVKAGMLPLGVVVERLTSPGPGEVSFAIVARAMLKRAFAPIAIVLLGVSAMIYLIASGLISRIEKERSLIEAGAKSAKSEAARREQELKALREKELQALEEAVFSETNTRQQNAHAAKADQPANPAGDLFTIQEIPAESIARMAVAREQLQKEDQALQRARSGIEAQLVEQALSSELRQDAADARATHRKRVAIAQFEGELKEIAHEGSKSINDSFAASFAKLTEITRELCHSPALFFFFDPVEKRARLRSHSGLENGIELGDVFFPVADELPSRVIQSARAGRIHSLSGYIPLASLMMRKLHALDFRAWAVPGGMSGRFLGALVVMNAEGGAQGESQGDPKDGVKENAESLARVIRVFGRSLEHSLEQSLENSLETQHSDTSQNDQKADQSSIHGE